MSEKLPLVEYMDPAQAPWDPTGLLLTLMFLTVVFVALWFWLSRQRKEELVEEIEDCSDWAERELKSLRAVMHPEEAMRFAEEVTRILRVYAERRFELNAPRQTSREFLDALSEDGRLEKFREVIQNFLNLTDVTKFARGALDAKEMERLLEVASDFVNQTRRVQS